MEEWEIEGYDYGGGGGDNGHLENSQDENGGSSDSAGFGFEELQKLLESSPKEVLLAIVEKKTEWSALVESPEATGDKLFVIIRILGEKICADVSEEFQQQQVNAITAVASSRPLISKIEAFISSKDFLLMEQEKSVKILQNVHNICEFVLSTMPSIAVDHFFKIITVGVGQSSLLLGDSDLSGGFRSLFQKVGEMSKEETAKQENAKEQTRKRHFDDIDMAAFDEEQPPNTIQEIEVIPDINELLQTYRREPTFLRPNKITGAYNDCRHYLDVQFRLLREDLVAPLRTGVRIFMKDKRDYISGRKRMPMGEIRLYRNVTIVGPEPTGDVIAYKLQLPLKLYGKINWEKSRKLQSGNLIILTTTTPINCFQNENTHFGVLLHRNEKETKDGIIKVEWVGSPPEQNEMYLLFESEVYLEAYRYTLEALKNLDLERFPMKRFIVDASNIVGAPRYLQQNANENIKKLSLSLINGSTLEINPLENSQWAAASELGFDSNQFKAFRAALTKEFTIIQGPPGTGKTFLGLQIAKTLLSSANLWRVKSPEDAVEDVNPMLVVCYTNHALDQFLEGILKFYKESEKTPNIVRVGVRCESEALKKYGLYEIRTRRSNETEEQTEVGKFKETSRNVRSQVTDLKWDRSLVVKDIKGLSEPQGLVKFNQLEVWHGKLIRMYPNHLWDKLKDLQWLGIEGDMFSGDESFNADTVIRKWFSLKDSHNPQVELRTAKTKVFFSITEGIPVSVATMTEDDDDDSDFDCWSHRDCRGRRRQSRNKEQEPEPLKYIDNCSIDSCYKSIKRISNYLKTDDAKLKESLSLKMVLEKRKQLLEQIFYYYRAEMLDLPDVSEKLENLKEKEVENGARTDNGKRDKHDLMTMTMAERWALYFKIVEEALNLATEKLDRQEQALVKLHQRLKEVTHWGNGLILKSAEVVGMTTTGAAKNCALLSAMKSKIVIVEEAAEVFEAHVVTCLTEHCQQLILIGDHKQLKPNPTVYDLAKKFNLDLSFFERMINNNLHCYSLKIQHRMRPMIADLVKDTIYEELENDASVRLYSDVMGLAKNVFFITHSEKEESQHDSLSKSNLHEAKFLAALCRHLILQGYESKQITILVTYIGQMFLVRKEVKLFGDICKGVRITCVDNFQGEENDIILLSLVRSNDEQKIGFVGVDNRICVALSRARHGLYVIGNMEVMFEKSKTWAAIKKKLKLNALIGESLELVCECHGTKSWVKTGKEFLEVAPEGGCTEMCNALLKCGHTCPLVYHPGDKNHEKRCRCRESCQKFCEAGEHSKELLCHEEYPRCLIEVERRLLCEWNESGGSPAHTKTLHCWEKVAEEFCGELVMKMLPCGHRKKICCGTPVEDVEMNTCNINVEKTLPCGHTARMACYQPPQNYKCYVNVVKNLRCGHETTMECHKNPNDDRGHMCRVITPKILRPCGHTLNMKCYENPRFALCVTKVQKTFPDCDHQILIECHRKDERISCKNPCGERMKCGHICPRLCHAIDNWGPHEDIECHHKCQRKLPCGHQKVLECFVDFERYKCAKKCEKKFECGHNCVNLCFKKCGPARIEMSSCGHRQKVFCCEAPAKENCGILVLAKNKLLCGHSDILVPCKNEDALPEEITKLCTKPCEFQFKSCGHTCSGNCTACLHGRIHLKCQTQYGSHLMKADSRDGNEIQTKLISNVIGSPEVKKLFPEVVATLKGYLVSTVTMKRGKFTYENEIRSTNNLPDKFSMMSLDYIGGKALDAANILEKDLNNQKLLPSCYNDVREKYRETMGKMLERHPLTRQEVQDFNEELSRVDYFRQLRLRRSLANCDPSNAEIYHFFERAEKYMSSVLPLTTRDKTEVESCLWELDERLH